MADQEVISEGPAASKESENDDIGISKRIIETSHIDHSDARSSSLSDYDERYDENENSAIAQKAVLNKNEVDSEAETERLDITPHQTRLRNDISPSENDLAKTPSKTQHQYDAVEGQKEDSISSSVWQEPSTIKNGTADLDVNSESTSALSQTDPSRLSEGVVAGRKRKRKSESDHSPGVTSDTEKPAEKRVNAAPEDTPSKVPIVEAVDEAEDDLSEEDLKELGDEGGVDKIYDKETPLPVSVEQEEEAEGPKKGVKARKGKRKLKRAMETSHNEEPIDPEGHTATTEQSAEVGEAFSPEGEGEEADAATRNEEELQRKRAAMDALAGIEEHFASFRERLFEEKLSQVDRDLALLQQPSPSYPEFLLMMQSIDARYNDEIRKEDSLLTYKLNALEVQTVAERSQMHSQYFQTVRDIREDMLDKIGAELFRIQKERRQAHSDEPEYNYLYEPNRTQQVLRQTKINQEVSLLSGIKKYHGFPAAPKLKGLGSAEIDDDLRAMKLSSNPSAALTRQLNEPIAPEKRAAEEFFAHTPWANAQHPAHHQNAMASQASRPMNPFTTPAPQRRVFDSHLPNGSGSTIAMASDPPSSALAAGGSSHGPVVAESSAAQDSASNMNTFDGSGDSPLVYMKRNQDLGRGVLDDVSEQWAQGRASVVTQGSPAATIKERVVGGRGNSADPSSVAREASGTETLGFAPSAGVKTEDEVHASRLPFAMQSGHGQGQARQVGIAAGGFGR